MSEWDNESGAAVSFVVSIAVVACIAFLLWIVFGG